MSEIIKYRWPIYSQSALSLVNFILHQPSQDLLLIPQMIILLLLLYIIQFNFASTSLEN